ncbi:SusC/RagA family TonB-linked outer membrane protein [Chitinophaga lutea]
MIKFTPLVLLLLFCITGSAFAQDAAQGTVFTPRGEPVPGATVTIRGASAGTVTDATGHFRLIAPKGSVLVISSIGMEKKEATWTGAPLRIVLETSNTSLSETVVIGYQTATRKSVTTAISSISSKDIAPFVTGNVANALAGKLPGVQIIAGNGLPGSQPRILVRGLSSITQNTNPLIIVDGVEVGYNDLNFINPGDIETMDVLKDASASAIYGSRGGQGVILITTKRGKGKPVITAEVAQGFDYLPKIDLADAPEYVRVMNEISARSNAQPLFPNPAAVQNTDYWDRTFDVGRTQNYVVSASGGNEGLSVYGSLGYFRQDSYNESSKGGDWSKITARLNADLTISKVFKMGLSFAPRYEKWLSTPNNLYGAYAMDPTTAPQKTIDSVFRAIPAGFMDMTAFNPIYSQPNRSPINGVTNPEFNYLTNFNRNDAFGAQYAVYVQAQPIRGMTLKSMIEGFGTAASSTGYDPKFYIATNSNRREAGTSSSNTSNLRWKITNTANYNFSVKKHNIDVLVGQSADNYIVKGTNASRKDIPYETEPYRYISAATTVTGGGGYYQEGAAPFGKITSYFGSVRYAFNDKYFVSGSMRADGSSLVNPDYQWGYFPTASAAWVISSEPFFESLKSKVSYLKLRTSWGKAGGNLPGSVGSFISTVGPINYVDANGNPITGYVPNNISNPEIRWEEQKDFTAGIDANLFRNKLDVTLEGYVRNPENLMVTILIDPSLGYPQGYIPSQLANIGRLTTKGWDLSLGYKDQFFSRQLTFGANLTVSHFRSVVDYLGNADPVFGYESNDVISTFRSRLTKGHEPGAWFGYIVDGVFQTDAEAVGYVNKQGTRLQPNAKAGDLKFRDANNDGTLDGKDLSDLGSPYPNLTAGLTLTLGYKGFDFRTEFYGAWGHTYNNNYRLNMNPTGRLNFISGEADKYWHGEGTSNSFPVLRYPDQNGNFSKMSSFLVERADFVRCRLMQLGYTVPHSWVRGMRQLRLYASVQNLFTITKYSGLNPDLPWYSRIGYNGVDNFQAIPARTVLVGINLGL